jgi:DNA-binding NtrC family response regulator
MEIAAREAGKTVTGIDPHALALLLGHEWPGNVRELSHYVERAVVLSRGDILAPDDFIPERRGITPWRRPGKRASDAPDLATMSLDLATNEMILIREALRRTGGNQIQAAELLGVSDRTIRNKLKASEATPAE